jgi:hypothetical protein
VATGVLVGVAVGVLVASGVAVLVASGVGVLVACVPPDVTVNVALAVDEPSVALTVCEPVPDCGTLIVRQKLPSFFDRTVGRPLVCPSQRSCPLLRGAKPEPQTLMLDPTAPELGDRERLAAA